ncbi:MAG TPA: ribose-phosphate pyrophosphokinase, partial [Clostridiales bacterium]|nr:ribose-phosphate pyrophosphokinase [Clostridiales bacterium]
GVLSGEAIQRLEASPIKELAMINTIPLPAGKRIDKIRVLSAGRIFAESIERIYSDMSLSSMLMNRND